MDEGAESDKCDWWSKEERIVPAVEGAASLTQFPLLPALSYTHLSFWTAGDVLCLAMRPSATGNNSATNSTSAPSATSASLSGKVVGVKRLLWCGSVLAHSAGNRGEDTHTPRHSQSTSKKPQKDQPFNADCVHTWVHLK